MVRIQVLLRINVVQWYMVIAAHSYVSNCLSRHLIPFLNIQYPQGGYTSWPDKASAHYARMKTSYLVAYGINYISKEDNPTEVPQCDLWRISSDCWLHESMKDTG